MPAHLSTVLYISECKEKISSSFVIINAIGYARLDSNEDNIQKFNITAFYPIDDPKPSYLPELKEGEIISVSNAKFCKGINGDLDVS